VPFSTAWIARTRLAGEPVSLHAAVFVLVNVTYVALLWETLERAEEIKTSARATHDASAIVFNVGNFHGRDGAVGQVSLVWIRARQLLFSLLSTARSSPRRRSRY
jgi:uncharacterized membrane protein